MSLSLILSTKNEISSLERIVHYRFTDVFPALVGLELNNLSALGIVGLRISYSDLLGLLFPKLPNLESLFLAYIELVGGGKWEYVVEGLRQRKHIKKCVLMSPLRYGNPYSTYPNRLIDNTSANDILSVNSDYIVHGGRHPALQDDEVDGASLKYLGSLDQELKKIYKSLGISA